MERIRRAIASHLDLAATRLAAISLDQGALAPVLARARLAQGKVLGATRSLDPNLTLEAVAAILVEDGVTTSAIEGERLDLDAVRSSVARHLGLSTAGLPAPPRAVDGLVETLLDVTRHHEAPLTAERLFAWQASLFPAGYSGLHQIRTGSLRGDEPMRVISGSVCATAVMRDGQWVNGDRDW